MESSAQASVYSLGEAIFTEGELADDKIFYLLRGSVKLVRGQGDSAIPLKEISEKSFFGEMAVLTGNPRTASAIVTSETAQIVILAKSTFLTTTATNPALVLDFCRQANVRYTNALIKLSEQRARQSEDLNLVKLSTRVDLRRGFDIRDFVAGLPVASFFSGDVIFDDAHPLQRRLYWLTFGEIELNFTTRGKKILTTKLAKGEFFGAISLLGGDTPLEIRAIAASQRVRVKYLTEGRFLELSAKNPIFLYSLLKLLLLGAEKIENQLYAA
ncbi:MAG: cyclic nucleotide-binding domain-containing protein [Turneriella sp.]|nr:cyclic nucleotide-binding domain-containing protein [Turneriella sp.]